MRDCLLRGEAPFASHALYTQSGVLDDNKPEERQLGIETGFAFRATGAVTVVYTDLGFSSGMKAGIEHAHRCGYRVEFRSLEEWKGYKERDPSTYLRETIDLFEQTTKGHRVPFSVLFADCLRQVCADDGGLMNSVWEKVHQIGNALPVESFSCPADFLNSFARKVYLLKALRGGL
jgi:hypothetical protein